MAVVDRSLRALARKELAGWRQFGGDGGGKAKQLLAMFEVLDPPLACALYFLQSCELPLFRFCLATQSNHSLGCKTLFHCQNIKASSCSGGVFPISLRQSCSVNLGGARR